MPISLDLHLYGRPDSSPVVSSSPEIRLHRHPETVPTAAGIREAFRLADGTAVAFASRMPDLTQDSLPDMDIAFVPDDFSADGRASADLVAELWRLSPEVAVLLSPSPLAAGTVVFSARFARHTASQAFDDAGDALSSLIAAAVAGGATVGATIREEVRSAPPTNPAPLVPDSPGTESRRRIAAIRRALGGRFGRSTDASAVVAGVLLWHDLLDESHSVSQTIEGEGRRRAGDYWHAIMHRREPDYGNAKYWFRRVGRHAVFDRLPERLSRAADGCGPAGEAVVRRIGAGAWDPFAFVDACAEAERSGDAAADLVLRRVQADEILLLLAETVRDACG